METSSCTTIGPSENNWAEEQQTQHDAEQAARVFFPDNGVNFPSPGSVRLQPESRLGARFRGNIGCARPPHGRCGEEMLENHTVHHDAPGKSLELVWDRECAGKWLDAVVRMTVTTSVEAQLAMADDLAASLRRTQQPDGYIGIKLPNHRPDYPHQGTCATVEWIILAARLSAITGDVKYIEALGNTIHNALLAAQSTDATKRTYCTPLRYHNERRYCCLQISS